MVLRFYRLRLADALVQWADALYRSDQPGSIARARELYKGVYWVHGTEPPVFTQRRAPLFSKNPAVRSQIRRAERGLVQIAAGLNYFGGSDQIVPALRYSTLKQAADHFADAAKSTQQDFLVYMSNIEQILAQEMRDDLVNANMLKKALLQGQIAVAQADIAQAGVKQAKQQVEAVKAAIQTKEEEIAEDNSFFGQLTDFCSGFKSALDGVSADNKGKAEMYASQGGTGAAAVPVVGVALVAYAGYSSISSMVSENKRLQGELDTLVNQALPQAIAQVALRQQEVRIAELQGAIAQADAELAQNLNAALHEFQRDRFLSSEFWGRLAALMKRIMRRYIELGARYAWQAERALAYEQDRLVRHHPL